MIGKRIIYEKQTGKKLFDAGEKSGSIKETTPNEDFPAFDPVTMDFLQLEFGERAAEFRNAATIEVDVVSRTLLIYQLLTFALDKIQIHATGVEAATLTVSVPDGLADTITVAVDGKTYSDQLANGQAVFPFTSQVEGKYQFVISSLKHGDAAAEVEVVP